MIELRFDDDPIPKTNAEAFELYKQHRMAQGTGVSFSKRCLEINRYLDTLGEHKVLAWDVNARTAASYAEGLQAICKFRNKEAWNGTGCHKALDIRYCGVSCSGYERKAHSTLATYLQHIADFYRFLRSRGWAIGDPFMDVKRIYTGKAANEPRKEVYAPKADEVKKLIDDTFKRHPGRAMHYVLCFYYGARSTEAASTKWSDFDLEAGWFRIGGLQDPTIPHKRKGNAKFPIDARMKRYLRVYAEWRSRFNAPDAAVVIDQHGKNILGWTFNDLVNNWWRYDANRLNIMDSTKLGTHAGRRFYTTTLVTNGLSHGMPELALLRGDKLPGRLAEYYAYDDSQIENAYQRYAP
jgi:integrase